MNRLRSLGYRCELDDSGDNMRKKIKEAQIDKIPYVLVIGDKEVESESFSVRSRASGDLGLMNLEGLREHLHPQEELGIPKCIFEN